MIAWALSAAVIATYWLMGNKSKWGPWMGLAAQILGLAFSLTTREYGLLPGVLVLTVVHVRNGLKWRKELP